MRTNLYDVVVVGSGMAGLTAAAWAAEQGQRVALVSIGAGAFVLGSGGVEEREVKALDHEPDFDAAMAFFLRLAEAAGTAFTGGRTETMLLPTLLGGFQPVQFAPQLVANSALCAQKSCIVGVRGLTGFDAGFLAERFNQETATRGLSANYTSATIELRTALGLPVTTLRVAQAFDRDAEFRTELAALLRAAKGDAERILLPAVLGLDAGDNVRAAFCQQVGCTVGELATLPPSIPGLRLAHRLQSYLRARGITFLDGYPVEQIEVERGLCTGLRIASPGRAFRVAGEVVVLATSTGLHKLLNGSLLGMDRQQRPLNTAGKPMAENLFAACAPNAGVSELRGLAGRILAGHRAGLSATAERGAYAAR
jgi:glycerol-3-phosphate dehydrogenase subunit B